MFVKFDQVEDKLNTVKEQVEACTFCCMWRGAMIEICAREKCVVSRIAHSRERNTVSRVTLQL